MKICFASPVVIFLVALSRSVFPTAVFAETAAPRTTTGGLSPEFCSPDAVPGVAPQGEFYKAMAGAMATMHRDMEAARPTGDVDCDFAAMMIPHHQGAIDMAKLVLLDGRDPVLRRLAQQIVTDQQTEIDVMRRQLADIRPRRPLVAQTRRAASDSPRPRVERASVSSRDRVYTGDQISNTVSVIDPASNTLLGVIRLGDPFTGALSPLYKGALLVHGLGFSPDHRTLVAVSIGSNSVTFIDTATNAIKGTLYVGRSPHEAFFTPDGRELWVAVRGEDYIAVIDPVAMKETRRIQTANGPGMVLFRPDGKYAFVPSSFSPELAVIETKSHRVIARVKQASPFSPNLAISPNGSEVWFTLKDVGKVQVIRAEPPFETTATLDIGPICNHVALVDNARGQFAYLTVGGLNEVQVWRRGARPEVVTRIPTGDLPHGLWPSGDGTRVYINVENGDAVQAIDALENKIIATIPVGQLPQALVYVPDAVPTGEGKDNLVPLGEAAKAAHVKLAPVAGANPRAQGNAVVNSLGQLDHLQIAATGLEPGVEYQLSLITSRTAPFGERTPLVKGKANPAGAFLAQALGPLRQIAGAESNLKAAPGTAQRFLLVTTLATDQPVLVQRQP